VTIQYAGSNSIDGSYGIRIAAGTPTIDHVTVDQIGTGTSGTGILLVNSGCPTLSNDTVTNTIFFGVQWLSACAPTATNPSALTLSNDGINDWIDVSPVALNLPAVEIPNAGPEWFLPQFLVYNAVVR